MPDRCAGDQGRRSCGLRAGPLAPRLAPLAASWLISLVAISPQAARAEPPDQAGLSCRVTGQRVAGSMSLEVQFSNAADTALSLAPGPHLVWYRDAAAEDAMENTVRVSRMQNAPLVVPAQGSRSALFAIGPALLEELRCNAALPAAAGLYFYQFNRSPRFRCLLQGYALDALTPKTGCSPGMVRP